MAAVVLQAASYLALFLTSAPLAAAALLAVSSLGIVQWNVVAVFLRQTLVPDEMLGRVNSGYRFIAWGTLPFGALCGGFLAGAFGVRSVFSAGAIVLAVAMVSLAPTALRRGISEQAQ
jgi:predicted MFS family arabinose efflux permease